MAAKAIVLGSLSPRRKELFSHLFESFLTHGSDSELKCTSSLSPQEFAVENARHKAGEILNEGDLTSGATLFTFDTVVDCNSKVFGKPQSEAEARCMLRELSSIYHLVHTGYALHDSNGQIIMDGFQTTKVWFQTLDENLMDFYISSGDPLDKAGAYGIQSFGGILIEKIEGCFYNVMGLPVSHLFHRLRKETSLLD